MPKKPTIDLNASDKKVDFNDPGWGTEAHEEETIKTGRDGAALDAQSPQDLVAGEIVGAKRIIEAQEPTPPRTISLKKAAFAALLSGAAGLGTGALGTATLGAGLAFGNNVLVPPLTEGLSFNASQPLVSTINNWQFIKTKDGKETTSFVLISKLDRHYGLDRDCNDQPAEVSILFNRKNEEDVWYSGYLIACDPWKGQRKNSFAIIANEDSQHAFENPQMAVDAALEMLFNKLTELDSK
ncbi:hypothetical protein KKC94_04745 [Patescibacteria group bacterium]|nr:hypothetical protein [Patescibacteria group bacterium]